MEIPRYAEGTFADLLEERINALEEFVFSVFDREEYADDYARTIDAARDYYLAMSDQLGANANDIRQTTGQDE